MQIADRVAGLVANGTAPSQEVCLVSAAKCHELKEIINLERDDVIAFYQTETEKAEGEENDTKTGNPG